MLSSRVRKVLREAVILGLLVTGILAGRSSLADHYFVPSGSMQETLQEGDRVFVDKRAYGLRLPFTLLKLTNGEPVGRGDVVIFDSPYDGVRLIKRIVAVAGDNVEIKDGHLSINGQPLGRDTDRSIEVFGDKPVQLDLGRGGGPDYSVTIDAGMVLAIGDHRGASRDGRFFGPVAESAIYGRAVAVYYRRGDGFLAGFSWLAL